MKHNTSIASTAESRALPGALGVIGVDASRNIVYISDTIVRRYGLADPNLIGGPLAALVCPDEADRLDAALDRLIERSGLHEAADFRLLSPTGEVHIVSAVGNSMLDDPDAQMIVINLGDTTDRERTVHLLKAQTEVVREIASGDSLYSALDELARFIDLAILGVQSAVYLPDYDRDRSLACPHFDPKIANAMATAISRDLNRRNQTTPGAMAIETGETIVAADLADSKWEAVAEIVGPRFGSIWSIPLRGGNGHDAIGCIDIYLGWAANPDDTEWRLIELVARLGAMAQDRIASQDRLRYDAEVDQLTGGPNRRVMRSTLQDSLDSGRTGQVVCFLDLDRLKVVNDALGHDVGDQFIVAAYDRLKEALGEASLVGRFGGDEFVVIVEAPSVSADEIGQRCVDAFNAPLVAGSRSWNMTVSVGVVSVLDQMSAGEVLRDADSSLYEAKRSGRACYWMFRHETRTRAQERMRLETQLPQAIAGGEITAWFQPVVDAATWALDGLECLARWSVAGQQVAPDIFIPIVEEVGLIDSLGELMIDRSLDAVDKLSAATGRAVSVAVNVSPLQLQSAALSDLLRDRTHAGRPVDMLCIEMTEQRMIDDAEQTIHRLADIQRVGPSLAVDDFGTGYSSLGSLHKIPASILKIDRSLVVRCQDADGQAVVRAVIGVAKAFKMKIVAEGVEEVAEALWLRDAGVDAIQGYLFARPAPLADVLKRVGREWLWDVPRAELET